MICRRKQNNHEPQSAMKSDENFAQIPMKEVGPVRIVAPEHEFEVMVPLATFERPLWPSVARGARVTRQCGGIRTILTRDHMARSILLEAPSAAAALNCQGMLTRRQEEIRELINGTGRFIHFSALHFEQLGNLLWVRLEATTGDAAGHNMITLAAEKLLNWILEKDPEMRYSSISGNYCCDKKNAAVNGILGRGRKVIAEIEIPDEHCRSLLKTDAPRLARLNLRKNLLGSILAGSLRSANAHFANMLLAFYLATGQDAANIVEGSQGITHAEEREKTLYFSVTLPNLILGSAGNGKQLEFAAKNLQNLGCLPDTSAPGRAAERLAMIAAATVLCGELSLLAAQTNPGELMSAHLRLERTHE